MDMNLLQIDYDKEYSSLEKFANFTYLFDFWLQIIEQGKNVASFFEERQYSRVAIYGMGILGRHLKTQLDAERCKVSYIIDKGVIYFEDAQYDLLTNIYKLQKADIIVVTPVMEYIGIKRMLEEHINIKIVSIEEVILSI